MKQVIIVGGGYAGLTAAARLGGRPGLTVDLYDARDEHHALPVLPDVVGRRFRPDGGRYSLARAAKRFGFTFHQQEVTALHPETPGIETQSGSRSADALLLATGTRTAFRGFAPAQEHACTLDDMEDALAIRSRIESDAWETAVVCGGGYTGVELATAIRRRSDRLGLTRRIILADTGPALCSALPERMQEYIGNNVRSMAIEVRTGTCVEDATAETVRLAGGSDLPRARLFWTAGKEAVPVAQQVDAEKNSQGRLVVDPNLQIAGSCFVAGDAAAFRHDDAWLRMGVHFSINQGWHAGGNIQRLLAGRSLRPFRPYDPGYLVPMANNRACGVVLGVPVWGRTAIALHYLMCTARSVGLTNRWKILADTARSFLGYA